MNNHKKVKWIYWVFTGLFAAFTLLTSLSQIISAQNSTEVMSLLRLPVYLLPFLGIAKLMGLAAILVTNFHRLKEWAYAGFIFDYLGATYAMIAVGGSVDKWGFMFIPIFLCVSSYLYYHKLVKLEQLN